MSDAIENPTRKFVLKPEMGAQLRAIYKPTVYGRLNEVVDGAEVARKEPYPHRYGAKNGQKDPRFAWGGTRGESEGLANELLWRVGVTHEKHVAILGHALAETLANITVGREIHINAIVLEEWAERSIRCLTAGVKPRVLPARDFEAGATAVTLRSPGLEL